MPKKVKQKPYKERTITQIKTLAKKKGVRVTKKTGGARTKTQLITAIKRKTHKKK